MVFQFPLALAEEESEPPLPAPQVEERPLAYVEAHYVEYIPPPPPTPLPVKPVPKSKYCSCVLYVKSLINTTERWGYARDVKATSQEPAIGKVVLTKESRLGHVALITEVEETRFKVTEANYHRCKKSERWISKDNPLIRGYR